MCTFNSHSPIADQGRLRLIADQGKHMNGVLNNSDGAVHHGAERDWKHAVTCLADMSEQHNIMKEHNMVIWI